jgi:hypothetical protein
MRIRLGALAAIATLVGVVVASGAAAATWRPDAWAAEDTVELKTQARGEEPHWFPVWVVVVDGQVYVRLGSRAAERVESNVTKPLLGLRVAGEEFSEVRGVPAPEAAETVNTAMAEKYWSDLGVRLFPHPLTLRLEPVTAAATGGPAAAGAQSPFGPAGAAP